jgi:hypothetical protein
MCYLEHKSDSWKISSETDCIALKKEDDKYFIYRCVIKSLSLVIRYICWLLW